MYVCTCGQARMYPVRAIEVHANRIWEFVKTSNSQIIQLPSVIRFRYRKGIRRTSTCQVTGTRVYVPLFDWSVAHVVRTKCHPLQIFNIHASSNWEGRRFFDRKKMSVLSIRNDDDENAWVLAYPPFAISNEIPHSYVQWSRNAREKDLAPTGQPRGNCWRFYKNLLIIRKND